MDNLALSTLLSSTPRTPRGSHPDTFEVFWSSMARWRLMGETTCTSKIP